MLHYFYFIIFFKCFDFSDCSYKCTQFSFIYSFIENPHLESCAHFCHMVLERVMPFDNHKDKLPPIGIKYNTNITITKNAS